MKRFNTAVVGLGVGRQHALAYAALRDQYDLRAICSLSADNNVALAQELGVPITTTRFEDLLAMPDLDVINICTPPNLHLPQAMAALQAGKHVVCEKPLCDSLREVDALEAAMQQSGKLLMPVFQYRFGQGLQKLKWLVERGLTGPAYVASIEVHWRRRDNYYAAPWRGKFATELGGVLTTHAIHAVDMLTYVLGPVQRVFARVQTRVNPIEVEDCAIVTLELANGALVTLNATLGSNIEITRHRFVFANMTAESNTRAYTNSGDPWTFAADTPALAPPIEAALKEWEAAQAAESASATAEGMLDGYPPPARYDGQIKRMYPALLGQAPLPVTMADARASIELLTAMYYSAQTGQPVTLPIANDHPAYGGWH